MSGRKPSHKRLAGLLLAAGRGRRMGALKQTLPWIEPNSTVISSAFDAIAPYCQRMFVVAGDDAQAINEALGRRSRVLVKADSDAPMFASIQAGLSTILEDGSGRYGIMLQPGDHPGVARATIESVIATHRDLPMHAIMPQHQGKGGHPAIIPARVASLICECPADRPGGLRQFWIDHPHLPKRLAVDDPLCTLDLDTPEDHQAAIAAWKGRSPGF